MGSLFLCYRHHSFTKLKRFFENTGPGHVIAGAQVGKGVRVGVGLQPAMSQALFSLGKSGHLAGCVGWQWCCLPQDGNAVIRLCFLLTEVSPSALCPLHGGGVGNFVLRAEVGEVPRIGGEILSDWLGERGQQFLPE